jgi:DNA-binding transcriptional regulator YiaG
MKMHLISLRFKPRTPRRIIDRARKQFSVYLEKDEDDQLVDWFKTDLHKEIAKEMTPGMLLKIIREAQNISQSELGTLIGVSSRRVSDYENGHREISKDIAKKLSKIFNFNASRFI